MSQTAQAPVNPPRAARLLLAEDEAAVREIVAEILVDAGYDVTCAADGKDALRLLEESGGAVDLLITDVAMPVVSGPELAQRVTERCPDCSILFLSGYPKSESIHRHVDWDRVAFLGKPFTRDDLLAAVRTQLAGRADRPEPPRQDGRQTALMRMA